MQVAPFEIERFYERWEFSAELMLSSSDCESRTVAQLLELEPDAHERLLELRLGYTEVAGSAELREAIAAGYERVEPDDVLALAAAEEGVFLVYHALLGAGDHVIVETPCYGSALELARSTGAEVSEWERHHERGWAHDLDALEQLLRAQTRMIYINSPHNPTGTTMPREVFERVAELAADRGLVIFSDEVYRGLEHDSSTHLPAAADRYERALSLGSLSKAYGLPGLRTGWLACRDRALLERVKELKLYTTICSSAPSEQLAALALRHADALIGESRELLLANLPLVEAFLARHSGGSNGLRRAAGRSASRACSATATCAPSASRPRRAPACCCCPATSTATRSTCGSASGAPRSRRRSSASRPTCPRSRPELVYRSRPELVYRSRPELVYRSRPELVYRSRPELVYSTFERNARVRSWRGEVSTCDGGPVSTTTPASMNTTVSATSRAKPISCVTTTIVMPSRASCCMTASTSPTSSGSSAEVGSSKSISFGSIASERAIATRCCWPPESCIG